ncbi:unnamed protein product [Rhizophagus irregularis]|nr:unnamed protein product [Rhizophagus irregularis]CAB4418910.1 unnamed protein product [Rhizophagus irregularis]CAB4439419.1 unnamed protein product [Rhizophagus irregularis]
MTPVDIFNDLMEIEPIEIIFPVDPVNDESSSDQKFIQYYQLLQRYSRLKRRQYTLFYAYKLGQLLENQISSRAQKTLFRSRMTTHFYQGCIRTYHIFLNIGVEQIFRTKLVTFMMLKKLKSQEFRLLCGVEFS